MFAFSGKRLLWVPLLVIILIIVILFIILILLIIFMILIITTIITIIIQIIQIIIMIIIRGSGVRDDTEAPARKDFQLLGGTTCLTLLV